MPTEGVDLWMCWSQVPRERLTSFKLRLITSTWGVLAKSLTILGLWCFPFKVGLMTASTSSGLL